ncbi:hypothetical protein PR202_gb12814 [Eleusine coracana subsp. coracana]|uniref:Uncharacterized protein n=1 Tax=Eleusine coracana subsp. coracana TaxID=191504 RepID=A0AAV5ERF3_ELECO|nr:hypothetical protein PR202_gb12814 [Eleusine coracana subsp. coracana]
MSTGKLTRDNLTTILFDVFTAGSDTVSLTVEWAMAELLRNPPIIGRDQCCPWGQRSMLTQHEPGEGRAVLGGKKSLEEPDTARMPLLQAVVKEVMRLLGHVARPIHCSCSLSSSVPELGGEAVTLPLPLRVAVIACRRAGLPRNTVDPGGGRPTPWITAAPRGGRPMSPTPHTVDPVAEKVIAPPAAAPTTAARSARHRIKGAGSRYRPDHHGWIRRHHTSRGADPTAVGSTTADGSTRHRTSRGTGSRLLLDHCTRNRDRRWVEKW